MSFARLPSFFLLTAIVLLFGQALNAAAKVSLPGIKYLAFQLFTDASPLLDSPAGKEPQILAKDGIQKLVDEIVSKIGTRGTGDRKLAFFVGPMAFDNSDRALRQLINDAFQIAQEKNIAVGFHLDDSMFWTTRTDLLANKDNVEWVNWQGTPNTGRRLDWGEKPAKIAPQMCFNSPEIKKEVRRRAVHVIGAEIKRNLDELKRLGKADLFAGIIAGWETQLGKDFETGKSLGYCALTHNGFSATNPPPDIDRERERVVQDFVELWTAALAEAGVSPKKIYSHIAFIPKTDYEQAENESKRAGISYSENTNFTPAHSAFGKTHQPGFSTYPAKNMYLAVYEEVLKHGSPRWGSVEGTNVVPPGFPGESSMETYLARMYNHGAALVNLFGWGVGGERGKNNPYRQATESSESIQAYRKFLNGGVLRETALPEGYGLQAKVHRIQKELPVWIRSGGDQKKAEKLLEKMMTAIGRNEFLDADRTADEILDLIKQ